MKGMLHWVCFSSFVLFCGEPSRAAAQPTVAQASEAETQRAREAFQAGKSAFDAARYDEALRAFNLADQAVASPNTKLMIARCLLRLDRPAEAYSAYGSVIRVAQEPPAGRYEQAAQAAAQEQAALASRIAVLTVQVEEPVVDATLEIAGRIVPRAAWAEPIALEPGPVEIVLRDRAGRQSSRKLALEPGSNASVELAFESGASLPHQLLATRVAAPEPRVAAATMPPAEPTRDSDSSLRTYGYVAGGAGVVALAGFVVFGALSANDFAELEDACPERTGCTRSLQETADRGRSYQTIANVSLGAGIAALSAGAVLWVLGAPDDGVEVAVGKSGIRVRGAL